VGGQETEVSEYPWQAGLVNSGDSFVWCGGSLVNSEWVLTAAHCTHGNTASGIDILLGEHNYFDTGETVLHRSAVAEIVDFPGYDHQSTDGDYSMLKLATPVNFADYSHIRPVCLPETAADDYADRESVVTGWGTTSSGGSTSETLREVTVNIISNQQCGNDYAYGPSWISDMMLCANVPGGGKDACQGDSGGPLVVTAGDGVTAGQNYDLVGVVSWGIGCADAQHPGVYARVTAQLDWIKGVMNQSGETCPRQ